MRVACSRFYVYAVPLYLDIHRVEGGVSIDDVVRAHRADLRTQDAYDVRFLRYWVDEARGRIFCLAEAPSAEAAIEVHRRAHGLMAEEVYQVQEGS
jgi:hypothetical protein